MAPGTRGAHLLVVGGGERPPEHVREAASERAIVALDGGAHWVLRWGLVPARVAGDLDSLDERTRTYTDQYGAPIEAWPRAVGRSDLSRLIDQLLAEPPASVLFTGCVGPRLDHTHGLHHGMARLALAGIPVRDVERWGVAWVAAPGVDVAMTDVAGERAAFFPLAARVAGIQLAGFDEAALPDPLEPPFDRVIGLPIVSDPAEVRVQEGALLVLVPRREEVQGGGRGPPPTFRLGTMERTE